jgi:hypothetical protein
VRFWNIWRKVLEEFNLIKCSDCFRPNIQYICSMPTRNKKILAYNGCQRHRRTFLLSAATVHQIPSWRREPFNGNELLLSLSMIGGHVSELLPPTGLLSIPQVIYDSGEPRWNDIDRLKPKNSYKNLSQCHFVHHKSHMDRPGREHGPPRWEAGCNRNADELITGKNTVERPWYRRGNDIKTYVCQICLH